MSTNKGHSPFMYTKHYNTIILSYKLYCLRYDRTRNRKPSSTNKRAYKSFLLILSDHQIPLFDFSDCGHFWGLTRSHFSTNEVLDMTWEVWGKDSGKVATRIIHRFWIFVKLQRLLDVFVVIRNASDHQNYWILDEVKIEFLVRCSIQISNQESCSSVQFGSHIMRYMSFSDENNFYDKKTTLFSSKTLEDRGEIIEEKLTNRRS